MIDIWSAAVVVVLGICLLCQIYLAENSKNCSCLWPGRTLTGYKIDLLAEGLVEARHESI